MQRFRRYDRRYALLGAVCFGFVLWAGNAAAQDAIGGAKVIENHVNGEMPPRGTGPLHVGDQVFQNELVSTAAASLAQLALRDETNVSLGPSSQIKLDHFVYDGTGSTAKKVVFDVTKGAFRFFSGNSAHDAYQVMTPQAVIGVRGTIYDVRLEPARRTRIVLQDGALQACLLHNRKICKDLTEVGSSLIVGPTSIEGPIPPAQKNWDFGDLCGGQNMSSLCARTTVAGLDLSSAETRTQLASLPRPVRKGRVPTKVVKRPARHRQAQNPIYEEGGGTYVPTVVTPLPVVPILPFGGFGGGVGGGFREGFGGRGGGGFGRGGGQGAPLR